MKVLQEELVYLIILVQSSYSKDGSFLGNHLTGNITRDNENTPLEYFAKSVLYEVTGKSLEESYNKMKDKLELNKKVKTVLF